MTSGDALLLEQLAVGLPGCFASWWLVRRDLAALPPQSLARAWPDATIALAALTLGPLAVLVHFLMAHRSVRGAARGLLLTVALTAILELSAWLLSRVLATPAGLTLATA